MVKTVVFRFKWPPNKIGGFFIDNLDYRGLVFWYDEVVEEYKEMARIRAGIKK